MGSVTILLLTLLKVTLDANALKLNMRSTSASVVQPASSGDLDRKLSFRNKKFQTWHEQVVNAVTSSDYKGNLTQLLEEKQFSFDQGSPYDLKKMGLTVGNFACGCPVYYTYCFAEKPKEVTTYCPKWRQPLEPWKAMVEGIVASKCGNVVQPKMMTAMMKPKVSGLTMCSTGVPLCKVADAAVDYVAATKAKDAKGYKLTAKLSKWDASCLPMYTMTMICPI